VVRRKTERQKDNEHTHIYILNQTLNSQDDGEKLSDRLKGKEVFCVDVESGLWRWVKV
jgi:hypothetical protein